MGSPTGWGKVGVELVAALSADPGQVAVARRLLRGYLCDHCRDADPDDLDIPVLLASELVTNAIVHAATPLELHAQSLGCGVRVEVHDGVNRPPVLEPQSDSNTSSEHGRGLFLVAALADRWGWDGYASGKSVWFELDAI